MAPPLVIWPNVVGARSARYSRARGDVDTATVGPRAFAHFFPRVAVFAAMAALALPQAAGATVYDKQLYDQMVTDGTSPQQARCVSALPGARVSLERYVDGYFVAVSFDAAGIDPDTNPQQTDENGHFSWEVGDGDYRVSVTKAGYWRSFSGIVSGPGAIVDEDVALSRRPGTPPPAPRDCPEPDVEPAPQPGEHDPKDNDGEGGEPATCLLRPVNARVRGNSVRAVVFSLDGRVIKRVTRPDEDGVFGITVQRASLSGGKHVLRAKVLFVRRSHRDPELLRLAIRRCPERASSEVAKASPPAGCVTKPFLAWVRANRVRKVSFSLDGRRIGSDSVADWRSRYGVMVRAGKLSKGRHVVAAHIEFFGDSGLKHRTVRMSFRKCD